MQRFLTFRQWPRLTASLARTEVLAGLTVALVMVPQAVAYAGLAGMPLVTGLYTCLIPALLAVLFGSANRLSVGPAALTCVLIGASLSGMAEPGSPEWVTLAVWLSLALLTLLTAIGLATQVSGDSATTTGARPLVAGRAPSPWTRVQQTLVAPGPWLVALAFFLYSGQWLAVVGFLPTIYNQAGYSGVVVGVLTALAAGINMVGNIGAGRCLARGMRPGVLLSTAYLAMALGAVVAFGAQGHPVWQYLAVLVFSGVGGLIPGTLFSLAVVLAPGEATVSTTVGWMQQFSALGQFLGPPLVAWVATQTGGWHWTWVVTGSCSLLGVALAAWLQRAWADRALR